MSIPSPIKWHGGKSYLADKIIDLMPPRCKNPNKPAPGDAGWLHYVEPYFGAGWVMLAMNPLGVSEVANDLHQGLTRFWRVLASRTAFPEFVQMCQGTAFSKEAYERASVAFGSDTVSDGDVADVDGAWRFFVQCRQSLAGRMDGFASLTRNRTRRGMNEQASAWLSAVDGLPTVHGRLSRVVVLNDDALKVIRQQDGKRTLFYLDPPYLHETRATTGEYEHEMTYQQHRDLLEVLKGIKGRFLLSGYNNDLYRSYANTVPRWQRIDFDVPNNAAGGGKKRRMTESVWMNY